MSSFLPSVGPSPMFSNRFVASKDGKSIDLGPPDPPSNPSEDGSRWLELAWFTLRIISLAIGKWAFCENWVIRTRIRHKKGSVQPCLNLKMSRLKDESTRKWKQHVLTAIETLGCGIRRRKRQQNWSTKSGPWRHWKHTKAKNGIVSTCQDLSDVHFEWETGSQNENSCFPMFAFDWSLKWPDWPGC